MSEQTFYLGIGKTKFNSSVCLYSNQSDFELILTERFDRIKNSGAWPVRPLSFLKPHFSKIKLIAHNRDVIPVELYEKELNQNLPFEEILRQNNLLQFSSLSNSSIVKLGHHYAHAMAGLALSPFEKAMIMVFDGGGSSVDEIKELHSEECESLSINESVGNECISVYLMDKGVMKPVLKKWQIFSDFEGRKIGSSLGMAYENVSEIVFGKSTEAGKVMGLAAYSNADSIRALSQNDFQKKLKWETRFNFGNKNEWEVSANMEYYKNISAWIQKHFEKELIQMLTEMRTMYPDYSNLILTGGCALNCTANMKIKQAKLFDQIYVMPFPGDESISLGCAYWLARNEKQWEIIPWEKQKSSFGHKKYIQNNMVVESIFDGHKITKFESISQRTAEILAKKNIVAWFQGRSECGPRALGHRSILAPLDFPDLKNYLNEKIKFRESFRPYGCSVLWEDADEYFECEKGFQNPFMSFAVPVRKHYWELLKHVAHVDNTSRFQTVSPGQNKIFYSLLQEYKKIKNISILLNTSLNVMNEPIVETIEDAKRFFENSEVQYLVVDNYLIEKN